MKQIRIFFALFVCFAAFNSATHAQCLVNSIYINTALTPPTYSSLTAGTSSAPVRDPHWIVTGFSSSTSGAAAVGSPAYVIPVAGAWAVNPVTYPGTWISVINALGYNTYGDTTHYSMMLGRVFRTCANDSIKFTLYIANDNWMSSLDVDGTYNLGFSQTAPGTGACFTAFTAYTKTIYLPAGSHVMNAVVNNYNQATYNPTGLDMYGTISSASGIPSIVYDADTNCNSYACGTPAATCNSVTLADSVAGCTGATVSFTASVAGPDSVIKVRWSPPAGLSDTTVLNPTLTVGSTSGYYTVTVTSLIPQNLIVNPKFDFSNSGFTNDYLWLTTAISPTHFGIGTNPTVYSGTYSAIGDHTTGTGNMMVVDGHTAAGKACWRESILVSPSSYYDFSAWVAALTGSSYPNIAFYINGTQIGTTFTPTATGVWQQFRNTWYSGGASQADISIVDLNTTTTSNDFALDDIAFRRMCIVQDSIYVKTALRDTSYARVILSQCDSAGAITLTAPTGYTSYYWTTGSTTPSISVSASGTYIAYCTTGCHTLNDTTKLTLIPYNYLSRNIDTFLCFPGKFDLVAPIGYSTNTWQDGTNSPKYSITAIGTYWVISTGSCMKYEDTFNVKYTPLGLSLGPDTTVCSNYLIQPSVKDSTATFKWQDGSTGNTYSASHTGIYYTTAMIGGCMATDTVKVDFYHLSQNLPDTFICKGLPIEIPLLAQPPAGGSVLWDNGSTSPARVVTDSGTYWVYVKKGDCQVLDTIRVVTGYCDCWYDMPTAFTPNADGVNDIARPLIQPGCSVSGYQFNVYNRWGELVYTSDVPGKGWDGNYKGQPADMGVYYYSLQFFIGVKDKQVYTSGNVTLVR